jgi:hypothetical protein
MSTPPQQGGAGLDRYLPTVPADWAPPVRTVQDALDQLGGRSGGAGFATSYVWRPGGVAVPGVYVTWAALAAAFLLVDNAARKVVSVDDSIANAHITTGAWAVENVEFRSGGNDLVNDALATINIDQGATFTGTHHLAFDGVNVVDAATTTSLITTPANNDLALDLRACVFEQTGVGGPGIITLGAGSDLSLHMYAVSVFGDGTHPVVAGSATSGVLAFCYCESVFSANAVNLAVGGATVIEADGSCVISATQTPAPTIVILDPTPTFVLQPGGTAAGNVFTDVPTMLAAGALVPGPKTYMVDDHLAAAHVPAGAYTAASLDNSTWLGVVNPATGNSSTLIFDAGAVWELSQIMLDGGMLFQQSAGATAPVFALVAPAVQAQIIIRGANSSIQALGAQPWGTAGNATFLSVQIEGTSFVGDATHNAFKALAGGTCACNLMAPFASAMALHAFGGAGTLDVQYNVANTPLQTQDTTTQAFFYSGAANVVQASTVAGSGTGTVSAVTGNISKKLTGKVMVSGVVSGVISGAGTVTVSLLRDATPIGHGVPYVALATATGFAVSVNFVDTLPDAANHTYTVQAVASAGTIATAANGAQIEAVEL